MGSWEPSLIDAAHQKSARESGIVALWMFEQKPRPQITATANLAK